MTDLPVFDVTYLPRGNEETWESSDVWEGEGGIELFSEALQTYRSLIDQGALAVKLYHCTEFEQTVIREYWYEMAAIEIKEECENVCDALSAI